MKKWYLIPVILAILTLAISCGAPASPAPKFTEFQNFMALNDLDNCRPGMCHGISGHIWDAYIDQDPYNKEDLTLSVTVYGMSEEDAKCLGDCFVRAVKEESDDKRPNKKIGKGIYNYLVSVDDRDGEFIVTGTKSSSSDHITWDR